MDLIASLTPTQGYAEELRLQGLIAREHVGALTASEINWAAIAAHYSTLERLTGSPVVALNRAVAVAECDGSLAGLAILSGLEQTLAYSHRFHAVRAELARRAGEIELARSAYDQALTLCANDVERDHLVAQRRTLD